jgi:molybdate transport system substrate-binding protein
VRFHPLLLGVAVLLSACGGGETATGPTTESACADVSTKGSIVVLAASSMVNVLTEARQQFLEALPCVSDLTFSYGSSATLATQIINGSPADIFISASEATMRVVQDTGKVFSSQTFATNSAAIMIGNSSKFAGSIRNLSDLGDDANSGIAVGLCVPSAPCGAVADAVLAKVGLKRTAIADTETQSAEDLVTKIEMGELDAGIVFTSDCQHAASGNKASCAPIPIKENAATKYLVAGLNNRTIVQAFIDYVSGSEFKNMLQTQYGFLAP